MTFYVQSLNSHEIMPLMQLFKPRAVEKLHKIDSSRGVETHRDPLIDLKNEHKNKKHNSETQDNVQFGIAMQSYHEVEQLPQQSPVLFANQIMTSPVVTLDSNNTIIDALKLFHTNHLRHIPVINNEKIVIGIISDRDVLRHLSGMTEDFNHYKTSARTNDQIKLLMKTAILTASTDTDVRYIARLFVEQRVGAMPIVINGKLTGIITRSDLLSSIMRHFILELWA